MVKRLELVNLDIKVVLISFFHSESSYVDKAT